MRVYFFGGTSRNVFNKKIIILELDDQNVEQTRYEYLHIIKETGIFSEIGLYSCEEVVDLLTS